MAAELVAACQRAGRHTGVLDTRLRVLSIDPGIRNFSYCVGHAFVPPAGAGPAPVHLAVQAWARQDLTEGGAPGVPRLTEAYKPSVYASTAVALMHALCREHQPDVVLIERQRHRSMGAASVQEWTIKVCLLEAMLWAACESIPGSQQPLLLSINPSAVVSYLETVFAATPEPKGPSSCNLRTTDRKAKAARLHAVDTLARNKTGVSFAPAAAKLLPLFYTSSRRSTAAAGPGRAKYDDLADSLAQCATWLEWLRHLTQLAYSMDSPSRPFSLRLEHPLLNRELAYDVASLAWVSEAAGASIPQDLSLHELHI